MKTRARPNGRPTAFLIVLCLVLGGYVVYAERGSSPTDPAVVPGPAPPKPAALPPPQPAFTLQPLDDFSETLARPLFLPSRRPLAPGEDAPQQAGAMRNLFTLMGVIISDEERMALVKRRKTGEVLRLIEGQQVDGWQVEAIMPDRVTLRHDEETEEVELKDAVRPQRRKGRPADRRARPTAQPRPAPPQNAPAEEAKPAGEAKP